MYLNRLDKASLMSTYNRFFEKDKPKLLHTNHSILFMQSSADHSFSGSLLAGYLTAIFPSKFENLSAQCNNYVEFDSLV